MCDGSNSSTASRHRRRRFRLCHWRRHFPGLHRSRRRYFSISIDAAPLPSTRRRTLKAAFNSSTGATFTVDTSYNFESVSADDTGSSASSFTASPPARAGTLTIQVGANSGDEMTIYIDQNGLQLLGVSCVSVVSRRTPLPPSTPWTVPSTRSPPSAPTSALSRTAWIQDRKPGHLLENLTSAKARSATWTWPRR